MTLQQIAYKHGGHSAVMGIHKVLRRSAEYGGDLFTVMEKYGRPWRSTTGSSSSSSSHMALQGHGRTPRPLLAANTAAHKEDFITLQ